MTYKHEPGFGSIFINDKKEHEKQPDFTGDIMTPDGKLWKLAGWSKPTKAGKKRLSLKASDPDERREEPQQSDPLGDDIPW